MDLSTFEENPQQEQQQAPDGKNPIYDFLKANKLTDKDEKTFMREYSDPTKAKEIYQFIKANKLTDKDFETFYGEYFQPHTGTGQAPSGDPTPGKLTPSQFAAKIRAKYPAYANTPDEELTRLVIKKYPEYADDVEFSTPAPAGGDRQAILNYMQALKANNPKPVIKAISGKPVTAAKPARKSNEFVTAASAEENQQAQTEINNIMLGAGSEWQDPLKALQDRLEKATTLRERTAINQAFRIADNSLAPDGFSAVVLMNNSWLGNTGSSNLTARAMKAKADDYIRKTQGLRELPIQDATGANDQFLQYNALPLLRQAAVKWYLEKYPAFRNQFGATGIDANAMDLENKIGSGKMGQIMDQYLQAPEVRTFLSKENPGLVPAFQYAQKSLLTEHRDYGINLVANEVSREVQKSGINNIDPIFNPATQNLKDFAHNTARLMYRDQPEKLAIYEKYIHDNEEKYLDTPSFFEGFASAGKDMLSGLKNTVSAPFTSTSDTIREQWEKEASHVSADPKGLMKFVRDTGHATGIVASIGVLSNVAGAAGIANPATASAVATSTAFFGDMLDEARMKYPNSPVKQWGTALVNTGLYAALSYDLFPAEKIRKAMTGAKPELNAVIENLASGQITREAARQEANTIFRKAINFAGETIKTDAKIAAEMTGITVFNKALDKVLMDKETYDEFHKPGEEVEVFSSMFLSNGLVAGMTAAGKVKQRNRLAEESLYEAASNPLRYERVIDGMEISQPGTNTKELLGNLKYLTESKKYMDEKGISPELQKKYLFSSIKEKVLTEKANETTDPIVKKFFATEAKELTAEKEAIITGTYVDPAKPLNTYKPGDLVENDITGEVIKVVEVKGDNVRVQEVTEEGRDLVMEASKLPNFKPIDQAQGYGNTPYQGQRQPVQKTGTGEMAQDNTQAARIMRGVGRIPVAPIAGEKPKMLSDILEGVSKGLQQKLFFVKPDSSRAAGTYSPGSTAIKLRSSSDLDVAAHEIGHSMDDRYGFLKSTTPEVKAELKGFSPYGSKPPKGHPDPQGYILSEGLAEFVRALVVNPEQTKINAPRTYELYEKLVPEEARKVIDQFSNDVRVLAGSTGRDIILSNIEIEPRQETTIQKVMAAMKQDEGFSITWADKLAANFVNPLRPFDKAFEYAKGIKGVDEVLPENDPGILARLMLGYEGKYGEILKNGMINAKNEVLRDAYGNPKNLNWLLEPLKNNTPEGIKEEMADVISVIVAERMVELSKKFDRETLITGVGAGIFTDVEVAEKALAEFKQLPQSKQDRIMEAADRYREFADDILTYLHDKGRITDAAFEGIMKDNLQYVALKRIMESEPNEEIEVFVNRKRSLGSTSTPLHEIKGSARKIQNPYSSLLDTLHKSIREADRNEVVRSFTDLLVSDRGMGEGKTEPLAEIGVRVKEAGNDTITVFNSGKPTHWKFQKDVYEALKGYASDGYRLHPLLTAHAKVLRWCVTNWPVFAARNWVRDFQDRLIKSNENRGLSGFKNIFGKKKDWKDLALAGGLNAGYYMRDRQHYYGLLKESMKELAKDGRFVIGDILDVKKAFEKYQDILQAGETSNRVAEFRSAFQVAKKKGMDDFNASLYAANKSRGLIDFAIMGHYMKLVNQVIPFSNAAVQGLRSTFIKAKENPKAFSVRMALYTVVPGIALWLLNHRDEETAKEYENLPAYQRDMYYNVKLGPNKWLSIPKPFEMGLPGAGVDRWMSSLAGNDDAFDGYAGSVAKGFIPIDQSATAVSFAPLVEGITNYDFFRGKQIVPAHESVLNLALRDNESSSRLGLYLQSKLNVDARKIDHIINAQFSYFGDAAIKLSNIGAEDKRKEFSVNDFGFVKNSPGYNSPAVEQFMNYAREWKLTNTREYKDFLKISDSYFSATTNTDKEKYAAQMIEEAKMIMAEWKKEDKAGAAIKKFNDKK